MFHNKTTDARCRMLDGGKNSGVARELGEWSEREDVNLEVVELDVLDGEIFNHR